MMPIDGALGKEIFDKGMTQSEVAKAMGCTRNTICRIEKRALEKMRKALSGRIKGDVLRALLSE